MAGSINKVIIVGNVGDEPEIRTFQNGHKCANVSVATSESWKDKATGERKEKTEWHRVVIFNSALVDLVEKYLHKGAKVYIEGKLETRSYETSSGEKKYTTEIVVRPYAGDLQMLDKRTNSDAPATVENKASAEPEEEFIDDSIPF